MGEPQLPAIAGSLHGAGGGGPAAAAPRVPHTAHPSYAQGYYDRDNAFNLAWDEVSADSERLEAWLQAWVYGVANRAEYWQKLGPEVHVRPVVEGGWAGELWSILRRRTGDDTWGTEEG